MNTRITGFLWRGTGHSLVSEEETLVGVER